MSIPRAWGHHPPAYQRPRACGFTASAAVGTKDTHLTLHSAPQGCTHCARLPERRLGRPNPSHQLEQECNPGWADVPAASSTILIITIL